MLKYFLFAIILLFPCDKMENNYPWLNKYEATNSIEARINVPNGYKRISVEKGSFSDWLRHLPLKPQKAPVKLWNGELKSDQNVHYAVTDLDFIGEDLQQCVDAIIRLRSEYLWSINKADEIQFCYSCCRDAIPWKKWKNGWRTKIVKKNRFDAFEWVLSAKIDESRKNFQTYLYNIMMYAGTISLSNDMLKINNSEVTIGDAYIEGGAPGYGHGVLILDMAISSTGKKIILLGQSYVPAQNFHILKNPDNTIISPWFEVDFDNELNTPQWTFNKDHCRRFK